MNIIPTHKGIGKNSHSFLAFLLFVCLSLMPMLVQAQKENNITLKAQSESVENVFNQISKQTGLKFFYDQETVNNVPLVTIQVTNATLQSVLDKITIQTKLCFRSRKRAMHKPLSVLPYKSKELPPEPLLISMVSSTCLPKPARH